MTIIWRAVAAQLRGQRLLRCKQIGANQSVVLFSAHVASQIPKPRHKEWERKKTHLGVVKVVLRRHILDVVYAALIGVVLQRDGRRQGAHRACYGLQPHKKHALTRFLLKKETSKILTIIASLIFFLISSIFCLFSLWTNKQRRSENISTW